MRYKHGALAMLPGSSGRWIGMSDRSNIGLIRRRRDGIREWLEEEAPLAVAEQKHLDEGAPERAYWHHGYQAALTDVMEMLRSADQIFDSEGIPN